MNERCVLALVLCASIPWAARATEPAAELPRFHDEIHVLGEMPFIQPVARGQGVRIAFAIGELEIEGPEQGVLQSG